MPPFTRIRVSALEDLAVQLRFAPRAAARRHVRAVIEMTAEIDPARTYARRWLIRRITGYEADAADEPDEQIVGGALLSDLSAFAERVSAETRMTTADLGGPMVPLGELVRRWGVDRKTIERDRRHGLVGLRVRPEKGPAVLAFPLECVEAFERRGLRPARSSRRDLPPGVSLSTPSSRSPRRTLSDRERRLIARALDRLIDPGAVARRLGVTRATVHRVALEVRAERLRSLDLSTPPLPRSVSVRSIEAMLNSPESTIGLGDPGDLDVASLVAAASDAPADPRVEAFRAHCYHALRRRAAGLIAELPVRVTATQLDEIETALRWAALLKVELVRGCRGLVVRSIEERAKGPLVSLPPEEATRWITRGFEAAESGVDRFDPARGGRLAAPVSVALGRALAAMGSAPRGRRSLSAAVPLDDWSRRACPWSSWLDAPARIRRMVESGKASESTALLLRRRFGWRVGPPRTIRALAMEFGQRETAVAARLRRSMRRE